MQTHPALTVLHAIFSMSSGSLRITRVTLGRRLGLKPRLLERYLGALERAGLVDARRLRLTLPGLAVAVSTQASGGSVTHVAA